jgi:transcription elongation factor Elf1
MPRRRRPRAHAQKIPTGMKCPHCKHALRHVVDASGKPPEDGDFIICSWCAGIGQWVEWPSEGARIERCAWSEVDDESLGEVLEFRLGIKAQLGQAALS